MRSSAGAPFEIKRQETAPEPPAQPDSAASSAPADEAGFFGKVFGFLGFRKRS
jgi:hypothetical protein